MEVINDEDDDDDNSALGRKTITVLPTVVTNSSNPKTVLVVTPENCYHRDIANYITHIRLVGYLPFDDEDGLATDSLEEVDDTTDGTENEYFNNRTL